MTQRVSKSAFKTHALRYFRQIEESGEPLVITDHGRAKLIIRPYIEDPEAKLAELRGTVLRYDDPLEPVALDDWESLR